MDSIEIIMADNDSIWTSISRLDNILSLIIGFATVWGVTKLIFKRVLTTKFGDLLIWSILGSEDGRLLRFRIKYFLKYTFAGLVWGIIGVIIITIYTLGSITYHAFKGIDYNENFSTLLVMGFISGFIFRTILLPMIVLITSKKRNMDLRYQHRVEEFEDKKERVELRMKKRREK